MQINFRNDGSVSISGYVNATEKQSHILANARGQKFREIIQPNVFTKAIRKANDILLLWNHDEAKKLGSLKTGNLTLQEDYIGLKASCNIDDSTIVQRAKERNFLQGWSFGFIEKRSRFEIGSDGIERRFIEDMDLIEVSLLGDGVKPAYPSCSVEVRSSGIVERRYSDDFEVEIRNPVDFSRYENQIKFLKLKY